MQSNNASTLTAHLSLLSVAIIYGINYFTLKFLYADHFSPYAVLGFRTILSVAFFGAFHAIFVREKIRDPKDLWRLAACALFGICINQFFFLAGMNKTSGINAGVLMITTPVFVFLIAWLSRLEKFSLQKLAGLIVSFVGAFFLIQGSADGNFSLGNESLVGDVMIIINAASYGTYLVLVRPLILKYNTFTIIFWVFLFGSLINVPVGFQAMLESDFAALTSTGWLGLFWILIMASIVAYFGNAWAMKRLPSSAVGMYIFVQPVFVTLITALFIAGAVSLNKLALILMILSGVFLVTWRFRKEKRS